MRTFYITVLAVLARCVAVELPSPSFRCSAEGSCPQGQTCHTDDLCYWPEDVPENDGAEEDVRMDTMVEADAGGVRVDAPPFVEFLVDYHTPRETTVARLELWSRREGSGADNQFTRICSAENTNRLTCELVVDGAEAMEFFVSYVHTVGGRPRSSCENGTSNGTVIVWRWGNPVVLEIALGEVVEGITCTHRADLREQGPE